ncbi:MAG: hypothetical protein JW995_06095 [Melioribacteraceae bacterium]|nr:hypothetical protein [Melioribacteraceae bacterium]
MKEDNKINNPVIILLTTIIFLLISYLIPPGEICSGIEIKEVDLLLDIREEEEFRFDNNEDDLQDDFIEEDSLTTEEI